MKKNHFKLLVLFPVLPLLTAIYYAGGVYADEYKNFELSFVSQETIKDDLYAQHFTLKNTGTGYINRIYIDDVPNLNYYGSILDKQEELSPFLNFVFEPGYEHDITMISSYKMPDFSKVTPKAEGYFNLAEEVSIKGTSLITSRSEKRSNDNYYLYEADITLSHTDSHSNYGVILKVSYDGNVYYLESDEASNFLIETFIELDLNKLEVLEVVPIKSKSALSHSLDGLFGNLGKFVLKLVIVLSIVIFVASIIVFCAIFFPAMARRKHRRELLEKKSPEE